jgi:GNAT superfamily N-acetyltransferase
MDDVDTIERCAYAAWPAEEVKDLDGWRLRAMRGVSRRANSVWTGGCALLESGQRQASDPLAFAQGADRHIEQAEAWYGSRGLSASFQLTRRAVPGGLDAALERRGYRIEAPVSLQVARARTVLRVPSGSHPDVQVDRELTEEWFEISAYRGRFVRVADVYRDLLARIGSRARYALARVDGEPAAVGLGVIDERWMGVFSMLTLSNHRRRGAGRAILAGLAGAALEGGVEDLYLQVERENAGAAALYAGASFQELYGYHYRVASHPVAASPAY